MKRYKELYGSIGRREANGAKVISSSPAEVAERDLDSTTLEIYVHLHLLRLTNDEMQ